MPELFSADDRQIKQLSKRLRAISDKAIPEAAALTLNQMAYKSRTLSIKQFEQDHVIRSNWTQRGMVYQKTKQNVPIMQMESRAGSIRPYAPLLEHGGTVKPKTGTNLQIPGLGARVGKSKRKPVKRGFALDRLKGVRRMPNVRGGVKQKFAAMLNMGRKRKDYGPFLTSEQDTGSGGWPPAGIWMLTGAGRSKRRGGSLDMVRHFSKHVMVKRHPFVSPAGRKVGREMDRIYVKNAKQTLREYGKDIK